MDIWVLGVNHKTAPLDIRERLSVPRHRAAELLTTLRDRRIFDERLLLSTCNRTEIYGASVDAGRSLAEAKRFLSEYACLDAAVLEDKLYVLRQPESVRHLFSVAAGLDSMVVGETEIIGQVKDAYELAHGGRQTGKALNHLFQRSLKVAKNLRTQTEIGIGKVSVASVAVDLAEKIFNQLAKTRVLVLGTGEMSHQVVKAMISKGAASTIVSSRHIDRARDMAARLGACAVVFETFERHAEETDILITATEAPRALVHESQVRSWMHARRQRPLFLIDIAVPRNIETAIEKLDNVYLYNIDDLQAIADKNLALRQNQLELCCQLVGVQTQYFMSWLLKEFHGGPRSCVNHAGEHTE